MTNNKVFKDGIALLRRFGPTKVRATCACLFLSGMALGGIAEAQTFEQYGTTDTGVALRWKVFTPGDGLPHPAILCCIPAVLRPVTQDRILSARTWQRRSLSPFPPNTRLRHLTLI